MDLLSGIESRATAIKLTEPGPTREHMEQIVRAGVRAPDHGRLRPWRFIVLEGAARSKLGDLMANTLLTKFPQSTPEQLAGERRKVQRAPTIVVAAAKVTAGKIPEIEQICAVTAAVQNMQLAAHALGYGAMWKTGAAAYDPSVKTALGLAPEDHIVSFLYLGTIAVPGQPVAPKTDDILTWL
jgi:nitroreductase